MISKRLKTASNYIDPTLNFADIGCDHGYLAIEAINKGVKFVQLIDNKEGPLKVSQKNLKEFESKAKVLYTLSDGLTNLDKNIDFVAICGMGGDLISSIINDNLDTAKKLKYLILEANSKVDSLRQYLNDHQFEIIAESFVSDKGKNYEIIVTKYNLDALPLTEKEVNFGPCLIKKMTLEYQNYLVDRIKYLEKLNDKIQNTPLNELKKQKILSNILMIKEILNETK